MTKARGELKLKDFVQGKWRKHSVKRTKFNSLCTQSNSQSTIRKKTIQAAPHLIIYADPKAATSAGANQITERLTDAKKWEEFKSYSDILVRTS